MPKQCTLMEMSSEGQLSQQKHYAPVHPLSREPFFNGQPNRIEFLSQRNEDGQKLRQYQQKEQYCRPDSYVSDEMSECGRSTTCFVYIIAKYRDFSQQQSYHVPVSNVVCPHNGTYDLCVFVIFWKTGFMDIIPLCCKPSKLSSTDTDGVISLITSKDFREAVNAFVASSDNPHFQFWWTYIETVQILLHFTRVQTDGFWQLHFMPLS